jgi:hypothetical protein
MGESYGICAYKVQFDMLNKRDNTFQPVEHVTSNMGKQHGLRYANRGIGAEGDGY